MACRRSSHDSKGSRSVEIIYRRFGGGGPPFLLLNGRNLFLSLHLPPAAIKTLGFHTETNKYLKEKLERDGPLYPRGGERSETSICQASCILKLKQLSSRFQAHSQPFLPGSHLHSPSLASTQVSSTSRLDSSHSHPTKSEPMDGS